MNQTLINLKKQIADLKEAFESKQSALTTNEYCSMYKALHDQIRKELNRLIDELEGDILQCKESIKSFSGSVNQKKRAIIKYTGIINLRQSEIATLKKFN